MSTTNKIILGTVAGLVVGLGIGFAIAKNNTQDVEPLETGGDTLTPDELAGEPDENGRVPLDDVAFVDEEEVRVKDQPAGKSVFVSRVALRASGWVVIEEDAGAILGAARFDAGAYQGTVELLRATVAGDRYRASLWRDDGDKIFDYTKDALLPDTEMTFEAYAAGTPALPS